VPGGDVEVVLEIREQKVFMQLGKSEVGQDSSVWIIDTGTMNHMIGSHTAFIELDMHV
jgi:hypothetical protein